MLSQLEREPVEITFPPEAKAVVDVTKPPYECDPSGRVDCTDALIRALDDIVRPWRDALREQAAFYEENPFEYTGVFEARKPPGLIFHPVSPPARILYLPAGTYLVSDTICYSFLDVQNANTFELPQLIQFRGQGEHLSTIKLSDGNQLFDAGSHRAVIEIMGGIRTNAAFHNSVEDLTIDVGSGNPGAIGLDFFSDNTGAVRRVTIRSSDPERRGSCGLTIRHLDSSCALFQDVTVEGFDYGIHIGYPYVNTTIEHATVRNQLVSGVLVDRHNVALRGLVSENEVPALTVTGSQAMVAFVDGVLSGGAASNPAVDLRDGHLFVRNVECEGYECALRQRGSVQIAGPRIEEYVHGGVNVLFPGERRSSLNLPIEETPRVRWETDHSKWACVNDYGAAGDGETDDTDAIRAAVASGKPVVYFQPGVYLIDGVIDLPATLDRLNFMKADLAAGPKLRLMHGAGAFRVAEESDRPIVIEDLFAMEGWRGGHALVDHASTRTLVLSDIHMHFCAAYRNSVTGGKVFIENVFAMNQFRPEIPPFDFRGQRVWARQLNPERNDPQVRNDGGSLWVLGFKTEHSGTAYLTTGGGRTEVIGGAFNMLRPKIGDPQYGPASVSPTIVNEDSDVSVVASTTDHRDEVSMRTHPMVEERRGEYVRRMHGDLFPKRDSAMIVVPLYVGRAGKPIEKSR
jgi:hypothetical protein